MIGSYDMHIDEDGVVVSTTALALDDSTTMRAYYTPSEAIRLAGELMYCATVFRVLKVLRRL